MNYWHHFSFYKGGLENLFAQERHEEILSRLSAAGKVTVKELCLLFGVTEDCIRKDLNKLEREKKLKRAYGGAVELRKKLDISSLDHRRTENLEIKKQIAAKAFKLLSPGDTVFIDSSTINLLFASLIAESTLSLTLMTNMLDIVKAFEHNSNCSIICTGGLYKPSINGFIGAAANEAIERYKFDKVFVGVGGINLNEGYLTILEAEEGLTKKLILRAGRSSYMLTENRKFHFDACYKFASTSDLTGIISEGDPGDEIKAALTEQNIALY